MKFILKCHWAVPLCILVLPCLSNLPSRVFQTNLHFVFIPKSANIVTITPGVRDAWYAHHICIDITLVICLQLPFSKDLKKKKKKIKRITSNATISPSTAFLTLSCLFYFHCLVLNESIKVSLVSISSSLIS